MPAIRVLQSAREAAEKAKQMALAIQQARREQVQDAQDVMQRANKSEEAREANKAKFEAAKAKVDRDIAQTKETAAGVAMVFGSLAAAINLVMAGVNVGAAVKSGDSDAVKNDPANKQASGTAKPTDTGKASSNGNGGKPAPTGDKGAPTGDKGAPTGDKGAPTGDKGAPAPEAPAPVGDGSGGGGKVEGGDPGTGDPAPSKPAEPTEPPASNSGTPTTAGNGTNGSVSAPVDGGKDGLGLLGIGKGTWGEMGDTVTGGKTSLLGMFGNLGNSGYAAGTNQIVSKELSDNLRALIDIIKSLFNKNNEPAGAQMFTAWVGIVKGVQKIAADIKEINAGSGSVNGLEQKADAGDKGAVSKLEYRAGSDRDDKTKATEALGRLAAKGNEEAMQSLNRLAKDGNKDAIKVLGGLAGQGNQGAVSTLSTLATDGNTETKQVAVGALGKAAAEGKTPEGRAAAAEALGKLAVGGNHDARKALDEAAKGGSKEAINVLAKLAAGGDKDAQKTLIEAAKAGNKDAIDALAKAGGEKGGEWAVKALTDLALGGNKDALNSLGELHARGNKGATAALETVEKEAKDSVVKEAAGKWLKGEPVKESEPSEPVGKGDDSEPAPEIAEPPPGAPKAPEEAPVEPGPKAEPKGQVEKEEPPKKEPTKVSNQEVDDLATKAAGEGAEAEAAQEELGRLALGGNARAIEKLGELGVKGKDFAVDTLAKVIASGQTKEAKDQAAVGLKKVAQKGDDAKVNDRAVDHLATLARSGDARAEGALRELSSAGNEKAKGAVDSLMSEQEIKDSRDVDKLSKAAKAGDLRAVKRLGELAFDGDKKASLALAQVAKDGNSQEVKQLALDQLGQIAATAEDAVAEDKREAFKESRREATKELGKLAKSGDKGAAHKLTTAAIKGNTVAEKLIVDSGRKFAASALRFSTKEGQEAATDDNIKSTYEGAESQAKQLGDVKAGLEHERQDLAAKRDKLTIERDSLLEGARRKYGEAAALDKRAASEKDPVKKQELIDQAAKLRIEAGKDQEAADQLLTGKGGIAELDTKLDDLDQRIVDVGAALEDVDTIKEEALSEARERSLVKKAHGYNPVRDVDDTEIEGARGTLKGQKEKLDKLEGRKANLEKGIKELEGHIEGKKALALAHQQKAAALLGDDPNAQGLKDGPLSQKELGIRAAALDEEAKKADAAGDHDKAARLREGAKELRMAERATGEAAELEKAKGRATSELAQVEKRLDGAKADYKRAENAVNVMDDLKSNRAGFWGGALMFAAELANSFATLMSQWDKLRDASEKRANAEKKYAEAVNRAIQLGVTGEEIDGVGVVADAVSGKAVDATVLEALAKTSPSMAAMLENLKRNAERHEEAESENPFAASLVQDQIAQLDANPSA